MFEELMSEGPKLNIEFNTKLGMHPVASDPELEIVRVLIGAGRISEEMRGSSRRAANVQARAVQDNLLKGY